MKVNQRLVYWSTEFRVASRALEVSVGAVVMMAPAQGWLPTSAEPHMPSETFLLASNRSPHSAYIEVAARDPQPSQEQTPG